MNTSPENSLFYDGLIASGALDGIAPIPDTQEDLLVTIFDEQKPPIPIARLAIIGSIVEIKYAGFLFRRTTDELNTDIENRRNSASS